MASPSEGLVKHFAWQIYDGKLTSNVVEAFKGRLKLAFDTHIRDVVNVRLECGKVPPVSYPLASPEIPATEAEVDIAPESRIETTQEEMEGSHIIKAIMSKIVDP